MLWSTYFIFGIIVGFIYTISNVRKNCNVAIFRDPTMRDVSILALLTLWIISIFLWPLFVVGWFIQRFVIANATRF